MYVDSYDVVAFENGGYFFSFLIMSLLLIQESLRKDNLNTLEKVSTNNILNISKRKLLNLMTYSSIYTFRLVILFGLYEIILFFILKYYYLKFSFELLYFGIICMIVFPLGEFLKILLYRRKENFPLLKLDYNLINKAIQLVDGKEIINIEHSEITRIVKYRNLLLIKSKIRPEYFIINREKK